ncbi:MAG: hypothetical protein U0Z44_01155 [Kouleothrix sp.]
MSETFLDQPLSGFERAGQAALHPAACSVAALMVPRLPGRWRWCATRTIGKKAYAGVRG